MYAQFHKMPCGCVTLTETVDTSVFAQVIWQMLLCNVLVCESDDQMKVKRDDISHPYITC